MIKRKDECLFCTSRSCYTKIYTPDKTYVEVACRNHVQELENHTDIALGGRGSGVMRWHLSSTGKLNRKDF